MMWKLVRHLKLVSTYNEINKKSKTSIIQCGFGFSVSAESYVTLSLFFFFAFTRLKERQNLLFMRHVTVHALLSIVHTLFSTVHRLKKILKMGPTVLFTHLKIILLQCFQFSVFSFSNNKFNPNRPIVYQSLTCAMHGIII